MKIEPMSVERIKYHLEHGEFDDRELRLILTLAHYYARWRATMQWGLSMDHTLPEVLDEIGWPKDQR